VVVDEPLVVLEETMLPEVILVRGGVSDTWADPDVDGDPV